MQTLQDNIHANILNTAETALVALGYSVSEAAGTAGDDVALVVYDEGLMLAWPPPPPVDNTKLPPMTVVLQPGVEREHQVNGHYSSNADEWEQDMLIGFTVAGLPAIQPPSDTPQSLSDWSKQVKARLIAALRSDRNQKSPAAPDGMAIDTRDFSAAPWSWGDGTACGYTIGFKIIWRTNYNDPFTQG